jgi:hypothetical protein
VLDLRARWLLVLAKDDASAEKADAGHDLCGARVGLASAPLLFEADAGAEQWATARLTTVWPID